MSTEENRQPPIFAFFFFQALVAVFLVIALLNRQRDLILLTLLVLVIMAGARIWGRASLRNLSVGVKADQQRLFPGETLQARIRIENRKWLPVRLRLNMFVEEGLAPVDDASMRIHECGLLWFQRTEFFWNLKACKRGVFYLGPSHTTAGDLLGFYLTAKRAERTPLEIVVYPDLMPLKPFSFPRKDFFGVPGAKSPVQDPIYLLGTRDYQQCQPARYIHWKASARHCRLQEKVFEPSSQAKILLMIDVASFAENQARDDFEMALEAAASITVQCDQKGYALGFLTNGIVPGAAASLPISQGSKTLTAVLEILARLRMEAHGSLKDHLARNMSIHRGAGAVCFSYENHAGVKDVRRFLGGRRIPVSTIVCRRPASDDDLQNHENVVMLEDIRLGSASS